MRKGRRCVPAFSCVCVIVCMINLVSMQSWTTIKKRLLKRVVKKSKPKNSSYLLHKEEARKIIKERLEYYNQFYNLTYNRVSIKDQRRCWGSCSSKGNLNFSYKLLFLPDCLRDYVVLHELCHLKVLNHSAEFWNVVALHMPDCLDRARQLRSIEKTVGTSLLSLKAVRSTHQCGVCAGPKTMP